MRVVFWLLLTLSGTLPAGAQATTSPGVTPPAAAAPTASSSTAVSLNVTDAERGYFELGDVLAKSAFNDASLARQTRLVSRAGMSDAQLIQIGRLAPEALRAREGARALLGRAVTLLQRLQAPDRVLGPIAGLAARLAKPLAPTGPAKQIAAFSPDAGTVLAALDESAHLSNILDSKALQDWATGPGSNRTGRVWYAEGLMAGVADIAVAMSRPDLLPPTSELATDLRGLRDWLSLRLPESPTPDQAALQTGIDAFLQQTSAKGRRPKPLTAAQLHDLGEISHLLQAQILPPDSPAIGPPQEAQRADDKKAAPAGRL